MALPVLDGDSAEHRARHRDLAWVVLCLLVLGSGMFIVRDGEVPGWERRLFHTVNDLPDRLFPVMEVVQQLGALAVVAVAAIVLLVLRRRWCALAVLGVGVAKLISERMVKAIVSRERPGTSIGESVNLRGTVPTRGESFVSGHATLVTALAFVIAPLLPRVWQVVTWILVLIVLLARVYVGAHNPLDVICGAGLGIAIGAGIDLVLGRRIRGER